jgi:hypothetical protein
MRIRWGLRGALLAAVVLLGSGSASASVAGPGAKAIWGPVSVGGVSQFPLYRSLGVGIFEMDLNWAATAPRKPARATNPRDPAYRWSPEIVYALQQAARYHMRVLLQVSQVPGWANGNRGLTYPPTRIAALADFLTAAARRFPGIHLWMIWGEVTRGPNFALDQLVPRTARRLTPAQARAPHVYAQMLDASYGALKRASRRNLVIGGNTYNLGYISTKLWIQNLRLPNGHPPRMDLYGHNPFCWRAPNLRDRPLRDGIVDFSDLGRLSGWVNRYLAPRHHRLQLFLSEWTIPTSPGDTEFPYWVDPKVQAKWISDAWRIVRHSSFIYGLGWIHVYDGQGSTGGLLYGPGRPKPGFAAFLKG